MNIDLHAHLAMHLPTRLRQGPDWWKSPTEVWDRLQAWGVRTACPIFNYPTPSEGPTVTAERMVEGQVDVTLAALYLPVEELISRNPPIPRKRVYPALLRQMELVERYLDYHSDKAELARSPEELRNLVDRGKPAVVHAIEGGFHLGSSPAEVEEHVEEVASRGVAYITIAHLFWWSFAGHTPALPFMSEKAYRRIFRCPDAGLTELGEAAVRAMVRNRVLIDLTHMSPRSATETLDLLDDIDPDRKVPVLITHTTARLGKYEYGTPDEILARVAQRNGVIGLIVCAHYIGDGVAERLRTITDSAAVMSKHIDHVADVTGGYDHVGLGTDFDGFVKPTLAGLRSLSDLPKFRAALERRYPVDVVDKFMGGNAMRPLTEYWAQPAAGQKPAGAAAA
jgi:microsomal dipeptidase-like Zn-dependent dipeptidase